ncbi:MAG: M20/M25/M40 family metallo-hydrolase [Acidimicrobiia bacterium]|nr:M20/M25/M40 family metallo-hydrolase [Acidimicrobiia bacterium]
MTTDDPSAEVTDLLQHLIRNACVNDGHVASGGEVRSVDVLRQHLEGTGLDLEVSEPAPGRANLVARIEGSDPSAPSLLLLGHTDVVPANADRWQRDPFGGELVDGEVWGRGAVDMLNLTASMAVALRRLADRGFRPKGTLIYAAVADEESLGTWGADHLVQNEPDAVLADYVITEAGGFPLPSPTGIKLPVIVGEKGSYWCTLRVKGTPGHASQPYRTDNAVVTAAEVVRRLAEFQPPTVLHDVWRRFLGSMGYGEAVTAPLLDESTFLGALDALPLALAREFHACVHTTFAPTIVHGGTKTNVIPDSVDVEVDIRTLPGQVGADVRRLLDLSLGDLAAKVEIVSATDDPSTASPVETPLWDTIARVTTGFYPGSSIVPFLTVGATDARFFRRAGQTAYGFGLFSERLTIEDYGAMFHGDDERVDVESLRLSTLMWEAVAEDLLA